MMPPRLTCLALLALVSVATSARADGADAASSLAALPASHASATFKARPAARPFAKPATASAPAKRAAALVARFTKPQTKSNGKATPGVRSPDAWARRQVAGGPTADDVALGAESPELRALHQAELELFPPAIPAFGTPWPNELASPLSATDRLPHVHATGLPPSPPPSAPVVAEGGRDLTWLSHLRLPDLPVRWDARLVRYLEFFKDDPRGRQLFTFWMRRSGRYREAVRRSLRKKALPEDLAWLAMIESSYDPLAHSPAGAGGLWQLTADTAHLYGLSTDRWADQRYNPLAETDAAVEMLSDLYRRFGSWELAMAAYNMGYGGVMSVVRRYNTNDYWTLSRMEAALPWETVLYVPKLIAAAIVGRNLAVFGFDGIVPDAPVDGEDVRVPAGTALTVVASAAGCSLKDVEALNPELRAGRTPPRRVGATAEESTYPVRVPIGKGSAAQANLGKVRDGQAPLDRYVVRFGESLEQVAAARKTSVAHLSDINAIQPGELIRGGTVLLVPRALASTGKPGESRLAANEATKPVAVVPPDMFVYPDRKRVFYRVVTGDTVADIATALHVDLDDLRRWNDLDPAARLQDGMTLQVFVPLNADLSHAALLGENDVRVLVAGTDDFFAYWEGTKGKRRIVVTAKAGDTLESIGRKHGVNVASMERINGRGRRELLKDGETVVVYLPAPGAAPPVLGANPDWIGLEPQPSGPIPPAPQASLLPPLR
jgi:membrane-bound lytic murein transglycosylase D